MSDETPLDARKAQREQRYEPVLLHFGENQVPKEVQKEAWKACDALVQVFKECSKVRGVLCYTAPSKRLVS
jgi:hypothetical protein